MPGLSKEEQHWLKGNRIRYRDKTGSSSWFNGGEFAWVESAKICICASSSTCIRTAPKSNLYHYRPTDSKKMIIDWGFILIVSNQIVANNVVNYCLWEVFLLWCLCKGIEYSLSLLAHILQVLWLPILNLCHHVHILEVYFVVH